MFERILVALDTSASSQRVFNTALSLARLMQARLMLANILIEDGMSYPDARQSAGLDADLNINLDRDPSRCDRVLLSEKEQQYCEVQRLKMLREFHTIATKSGIGADLAQPLANPSRMLCDLAINWGADLIVMGRRSTAELEESLQDSVSDYVVNHAPCPVLIVQHQLNGPLDMQTTEMVSTFNR